MDRNEVITQRATESAADFMANGPRLWAGRQSYVLARGEGQDLLGGLGSMGVGSMWVRRRDDASDVNEDETYADAPFNPGRRDDFGDVGTAAALAEKDRLMKDYEASRANPPPKPTATG